MKTHTLSLCTAVVSSLIVLAATTASAQAPQGGILDPSGSGVIQNFKTPPLADSDVFIVPIDVHSDFFTPNWAGVRMSVHVLDAGEVDVDGISYLLDPVGVGGTSVITDPFGPRSNNVQSSPRTFTVFDPNWPNSGITLQPSMNQPVFDITLHAKNTDPIFNSDVDITLQFSNIYHVPEGPGSSILTLFPSWFLFVSSNIVDTFQLHTVGSFLQLPSGPVDPETGHWLHFTDTATFHLNPGPGSALYATPGGGSAFIGIEHIPEPSRAVLLALGGGAVLLGVRSRRRRTKA